VIAVCELQCKEFSHEKFNSGFLHGLRLAFPDETIRLYADPSHIAALQRILAHDQVVIADIEWVPIRFQIKSGVRRALDYRALLRRIFREILDADTDRLFLLSFNPEMLHRIKRLKQQRRYGRLRFTLVLHGSFESIAPRELTPPTFSNGTVLEKVRRTSIKKIPGKVLAVAARTSERFLAPWRTLASRLYGEKEMLLWRHCADYHYICLAPHVKRNAARYFDVEYLNFHVVMLPTVFAAVQPRPRNAFAKFAMFGYGNAAGLHDVLVNLSRRQVASDYEIRVIGMDNRGLAGFPHASCPGAGRPLDRSEMEEYARDIDMFLILYDRGRYRLSCSGSILESLSYMKPVLHIDNECINSFNTEALPIGVRCESLEEVAAQIQEIAENYEVYGATLDRFRDNLLQLRTACSIESWVEPLRRSFTWPS
jgi:hypothetical protein